MRAIAGLSELVADYDAVLSDVWGVVHNGEHAYEPAAVALRGFRERGGKVVLITNSPRPREDVLAQFNDIGVSGGICDSIVTSGDVTRELVRQVAGDVYHIGPPRERSFFDGLDVSFVDLETAKTIVCTGLVSDEVETPEDYRPLLSRGVKRRLPMICANPDIVVERGDRMIWCAGALARLYGELGGEVRLAGKPHKPIYDVALAAVADISHKRVLCIGDGMPTDVAGAQAAGLDLLYISAGIHAAEYGPADAPDHDRLAAFVKQQGVTPVATMPRLVW